MQLDLKSRPLSHAFSRHYLHEETDSQGKGWTKGLFLGLSIEPSGNLGRFNPTQPGFVQLIPTKDGKEAAYSVNADESKAEILLDGASLTVACDREKTLLVSGKNAGLIMKIRLTMGDSIIQTERGYEVIMSADRYVITPVKGTAKLDVKWELNNLRSSDPVLTFEAEDGILELAILDTDTTYDVPAPVASAYEAAEESGKEFEAFLDKLVVKDDPEAAYDLWIGLQYRRGLTFVDANRVEKQQANALDQTLAALAFADTCDRVKLLGNLFAQATKKGLVPSYFNNYTFLPEASAPVYGLALKGQDFSKVPAEELSVFYEGFSKAVGWWFENRKSENGCFYAYPHECGWNGKPILNPGRPCVSPDLLVYLIMDCEALSEIAEVLGKDTSCWKSAKEELKKSLVSLWDGEGFVCRDALNGETKKAPAGLSIIPLLLAEDEECEVKAAVMKKAEAIDLAALELDFAEMAALGCPALAEKVIAAGTYDCKCGAGANYTPARSALMLALKERR